MQCVNCGKEFKSEDRTDKWCSDECLEESLFNNNARYGDRAMSKKERKSACILVNSAVYDDDTNSYDVYECETQYVSGDSITDDDIVKAVSHLHSYDITDSEEDKELYSSILNEVYSNMTKILNPRPTRVYELIKGAPVRIYRRTPKEFFVVFSAYKLPYNAYADTTED